MPDIVTTLRFTADLNAGVSLLMLRQSFLTGDAGAHEFRIRAVKGHETVDLTGASVSGYLMRSDGTTLPLDGTVVDGEASLVLTAGCYSVPGRFLLSIQAVCGDATSTLFLGEGLLRAAVSDQVVLPVQPLNPTLENIAAKVEEMVDATAAAQAAVAGNTVRNLLDNPCFLPDHVINQRGAQSYAGAVYSIDRWRSWESGQSVTLGSGGITITSPLCQYVAADVSGSITAAVCDSEGNVTVVSGDPSAAPLRSGCIYASASGGQVEFIISVAGSYRWAALYRGVYTARTLPAFQLPDPAAELAKCRRCFQRVPLGNGTLAVHCHSATSARQTFFLPQMRITPTVTTDNPLRLLTEDGVYHAVTAMSAASMGTSSLVVEMTSSSLTSGGRAVIHPTDSGSVAHLDFSADR